MPTAERPVRATRAVSADLSTKKPKPPLKKVLPEVWKLVKPRLGLIIGCFFLMIVNKLCSLVLPMSSGNLINDVM